MSDEGNDSGETLESVLSQWATLRGRIVVCVKSNTRSSLGEQHVLQLWGQLRGMHERVDLIIHSYGGDANSAFQIVELIRKHMKDPKNGLTAIVPFRAASAATLMCLGCDEIMLDELARLGPLDAQIFEEAKGGAYRLVSALNPQEAIKQLNELAITSLMSTKSALAADGVLPGEAYEIATSLVMGLFSKLYEQVSPERLAEYSRTLAVGREYASCLLKRHSKLSPADQSAVVDKLVKGYPSHGYYIDHVEASEMKMKVIEVPHELQILSTQLLTQIFGAASGVVVVEPSIKEPTSQSAQGGEPPQANSRKKQPTRNSKRKRVLATSYAANGKQK